MLASAHDCLVYFFVISLSVRSRTCPYVPGGFVSSRWSGRGRTLDLRERIDPGYAWKMHFWEMPYDWQGATVRLIAEDKGTGKSVAVGQKRGSH